LAFLFGHEIVKAAHALAALGAGGDNPKQVWLEDLPNHVRVIVDSELAAPVG
jgi:hypothetical protein